MSAEILNVYDAAIFDDSLSSEEYHTYLPRIQSFNASDEIRIPINHQDIYTYPHASYIFIQGKIEETPAVGGTGDVQLVNNAFLFLFDEIRYEINGVEIDRNIKPGITSTIKGYISYSDNESKALQSAGWIPKPQNKQPTFITPHFTACIPLNFILGFAEDYKKIIINARQELVLLRARNDDNCYKNSLKNSTKEMKIYLTNVDWRIRHITVNDKHRLQLLNALNKDMPILLPFRKWELFELPSLRPTKKDIWSVKSSTSLERPRYVIIAFQSKTKDDATFDSSDFQHANMNNIKLHLNSSHYPYDNLNLSMIQKRYGNAYNMYTSFRKSYCGGNKIGEPLLDFNQFHDIPLFVIDCSKQLESIKSSTVDIKLDLESDVAFNDNISAFCLIIHDTIIQYRPLTGLVQKII
ncbi:uncharacterized protein [Onthophagus taurus]|uniref:uncharacterized protein n=1 Tax=Onthophagus taurus TaxID=166361 RepID=UPI0039BDCAAD